MDTRLLHVLWLVWMVQQTTGIAANCSSHLLMSENSQQTSGAVKGGVGCPWAVLKSVLGTRI